VEEQFKAKELVNNIKPLSTQRSAVASDPPANTFQAPLITEKDKKESLFGFSFMSSSSDPTKSADNENKKSIQQTQGGVSATMSVMSEAHERLQERGEKLSMLANKTDEMANQASEFARLARQLNEQQKSRWF
jgi:hypothetical protein